jgi:chromosome segregation ATPase
MTATEANTEPTLFDQRSLELSATPELSERSALKPSTAQAALHDADAAESSADATQTLDAADADDSAENAVDADAQPAEPTPTDRKRLEEQLDALKRKELELRRALAVADHPELRDAIRAIEGRAWAVARAEEKIAQGLSKSEARRREGVTKKLGTLRDKRAELDAQITTLETELEGLGTERLAGFEEERRLALQQLLLALGTHDAELRAAGLEADALIPDISRWLPELDTIAKQHTA